MKYLFFGLSITSAWGNGHATTYRGLLRALAARGHQCTFFEQRTDYYQANRDLDPAEADYVKIELYDSWEDRATQARASRALTLNEVVVVGSYCFAGAAIADYLLQRRRDYNRILYYDIDTPVTLERLAADGATPYIRGDQLARFDGVLSFTGGPALDELRDRWGVARPATLYCGFDPAVHHPVPPDARFTCALGYMGTYSAERHATVTELLLRPAQARSTERFIIAGPQYPDVAAWPPNVENIPHLYPRDHAAFYCSNGVTLNATRAPMVRVGYCPSVRLFEAAGCGAPIISDVWPGLETLLTPGEEILLARTHDEVLAALALPAAERARLGQAAHARALRDHTYAVRAAELDAYVAAL
jgi:spore maturation protein CgeB